MRRTFLADSNHDCGEELEVTVERSNEHERGCPGLQAWDIPEACRCDYPETYRLVSWPSTCKRGRPIPLWEPTQDELRVAYALPESEET